MSSQEGAFHTGQFGIAWGMAQKCGIDPALLSGTMGGNEASVEALSRELLLRVLDYQAASRDRNNAALQKVEAKPVTKLQR